MFKTVAIAFLCLSTMTCGLVALEAHRRAGTLQRQFAATSESLSQVLAEKSALTDRATAMQGDITALRQETGRLRATEADLRPLALYRATGKLPSWVVRTAVMTVLDAVDWSAVPEVLTDDLRARAAAELDLPAPLPPIDQARPNTSQFTQLLPIVRRGRR